MPDGPGLVVATIWVALVFYVVAEFGRARASGTAWARPVWIAGGLWYLVHVVAAFGVHHQWSHDVAVAYTASQTEALTGIRTGAGLWVNYVLTVLWLAEGLLPSRWAPTASRRVTWLVRAAFLFMIVNGGIVFVAGPRRWLGVATVAALVWIWRPRMR